MGIGSIVFSLIKERHTYKSAHVLLFSFISAPFSDPSKIHLPSHHSATFPERTTLTHKRTYGDISPGFPLNVPINKFIRVLSTLCGKFFQTLFVFSTFHLPPPPAGVSCGFPFSFGDGGQSFLWLPFLFRQCLPSVLTFTRN